MKRNCFFFFYLSALESCTSERYVSCQCLFFKFCFCFCFFFFFFFFPTCFLGFFSFRRPSPLLRTGRFLLLFIYFFCKLKPDNKFFFNKMLTSPHLWVTIFKTKLLSSAQPHLHSVLFFLFL